jgi:hypothetical protein
MALLKHIEQLRAEEWSRTYLWDIQFPSFGSRVFPAISVEEDIDNLQTHELQIFNTTLKVPLTTSNKMLKVTYIEFADHALTEWLTKWYREQMFGNGQYTSTVAEAVRQCFVYLLRPDRTILRERQYLVYPEGEIQFSGTSDSATVQASQSFVIAGY